MNAIELVWKQPWVARAGWTLVHFLWQGTLIAALLAAVRGAAGRRLTPRTRYAMACLALGLMAVAPLATFLASGSADPPALPAPAWRVSGAEWEQVLPWLVAAWLCGVAVFSVRLMGGWRLTARLRTVGVKPAPREWQQALDGLIRRMRVCAPVRLLISSRVAVPVVAGWLRPVILMPAAALTGLPVEQVRALLAHELAHILRHDYLVNILQNMAEALLFYHPAVWWVSGQIRSERELCCDDLAVGACGDALTYAYALADLDSGRRGLKTVLAADGGSLLQRIRRLAGERQPLHNLPGPGTAWALSLLWVVGVGAAAIHASQTPAPRAAIHAAAPAPFAAASVTRAPASPVVSALLFDPFFAAPQTPVADSSVAAPPKKIHVEGTILSLGGEPLKKATVRLMATEQLMTANGSPAQPVFTVTTDDAGKFAIEDPAPGHYTLAANKTGYIAGSYGARSTGMSSSGATLTLTEGAQMADLNIKLTPQAIITGHVVNVDGEPVPHGWMKLFHTIYVRGRKTYTHQLTQTNSLGNYSFGAVPPGRYILSGQVLDQSPDVEPGMGDLPTYYPNALDPTGAAQIEVGAGGRLDGINIRLRRERTYSVTGKVMYNGAPMKGQLYINVTPPDELPEWTLRVADGTFYMHNQAPGLFKLQLVGGGGIANTLSGKLEFTIKDENLDGLALQLDQGVVVSGVLKMDGNDWQSQFSQPADASGAPTPVPHPTMALASDEGIGLSTGARVNDDGSFRFQPVGTGRYLLNVMGLPKGAYVKSARYGPEDVTRAPLRIGAAPVPLEIDVSSKGASVTGALASESGEPMPGVMVTAWPKIPNPGSTTHGVKSISTDQNGAFTITALAPGDYYVAAWEEVDSSLRQEPDFLARFTDQATAVKLDESVQASVSVKMISKDAVAVEVAKLP
jgi:beta-lactamase regulating signal transducer with metallopeptidase domain